MGKAPYQKLRWEIITAIIGFSVVPLLLLGAFIYQEFNLSYTAKIQESLKTLTENRRASLDLFLEERVSQLVTLAETNSLERLKDEDYLHKVFNIIQTRSRSYIDLGVIDEEGNHLAYVGPYYSILKGVNYKNEEWFSAVMASGVYVSDVFTGFRRIPHFIIAVMVRERNKIWILRATIDSEIVENIVRAALIGKHGDAFLVNRENILQTSPRFHGKLLEPVSCSIYGEACPNFSRATATTVEEKSFRGLERLYGVSVLQNKKWVLVIIEDPLEQLSPLFRARYLGLLIGLGGILVIVVGALFITRAMMKELERMERKKAAADEISIQSAKMAALGKMAAGIAHEINNPLAVISEKAGWMKDLLKMEDLARSENFQEFAEAVNKIDYHINRAKTVTHRLLGFARRMEPVSEKVGINRVLDETINFLENEARYRNIDIQTDYAQDLPYITSDSTQLQQVFLNILNNAIDAIGKDGEILIRTSFIAKNNAVAIKISDTGPGIPKEALNKIFDPFFTTKEVGQGTGLGLSISHSIVEKLGGRMMVASQEGAGTTFTIYLPVDIEKSHAIS
jgi:two-component system NtrC family sensor kinase